MTRLFLTKGKVVSIDVENDYVKLVKNKFKANKNFEAISHDISSNVSELTKYHFDTVICINVLHHIKNDNKAISNIFSLLEPRGTFILMEPAMKSLYGTLDKNQNHYRRYSAKEVKKKMLGNGFKVKECFLINIIGALGWFLAARVFKKKELSSSGLKLFDWLIPYFIKIEKILRLPFGLSVICICEK
ncbi:methyltransferase domain-containing protein [Candidatus Woesearchaeota archaeon]|nr:methyltransferase domain-containing protein [Candidatus Woesearchaeota archaeon]